MRFADLLMLSLKPWSERRVRAALLVVAVAIGVASVIALVSQTAGVQQAVVRQLQTLGPTAIVITPIGRTQLTDADIALLSSIPNIQDVIPMLSTRVYISRAGQDVELTLVGVDPLKLEALLGDVRLIEGQLYPPAQVPIGVAGYEVAYPPTLGGVQEISVSQALFVEQRAQSFTRRIPLMISGILDRYGASAFVSIDGSIFMPIDMLKTILNRRDYNLILVRADTAENVQLVVDQLTTIYGERARIVALQSLASTVSSVIGQFGVLLGSVAGISLAVAGLGIMNIMLVTVIERTKEIGVMKAVGYSEGDILQIFIMEALFIGLLGGVVGVVLGVASTLFLPMFFGGFLPFGGGFRPPAGGPGGPFGGQQALQLTITPAFTPEIILTAFSIAVIISVAAGIYPAWRASRMDPIKAIRYE
ncbi:conserved hypothetical protein [Candidatus Caldarchaeum subterraneum]|uniref:Hypothetical conserved protein n=2 Tax=Caldiarchaeum subterraneum TaxID=311458 RepID=E6N3Y8_CALS0|nr:hypothetical conserved protein [Candidatus Caldarchaeum subterraneum]BAJ50990.1 conserved hypothetical protein [Candidatus Caldarchaeum subterraneum]GBC72340.1 Macrolide export ATP-binding/permease protein MacB [archaeon HR03]